MPHSRDLDVEKLKWIYLFLVKQKDCYGVVKVETVDMNLEYDTKAYRVSSFNHDSYQISKTPLMGVFD
ncbi:DUF3992 domain-containing protein [Bacillus sp. NPDC094106]|uniref:DUF3992 domain-containing protein n=1 Tax=Bacillus sp. NPDC094106 TaxID=3363949 RepID=UPI00380334D7